MKAPPNAYQQAVGQLMRQRREELGVSRTYVSRALSISDNGLGYWERGERNMRVEDLAQIARLYGVTTRDLMPADPDGHWWSR